MGFNPLTGQFEDDEIPQGSSPMLASASPLKMGIGAPGGDDDSTPDVPAGPQMPPQASSPPQAPGGADPGLGLAQKIMASPSASPQLKDMMAKKYSLGDYSDEKRKALTDANSGYDTTGAIAGALASIGAGFQGRDSVGAANNMMAQRRAMRDDQLKQFDAGRAGVIQNNELQKQADLEDPNSRQSKVIQQTIKSLYPGQFSEQQINQMTAADKDSVLKPLELKAKMDELKQVAQLRADAQKDHFQDRADMRAAAAKAKEDADHEKYVTNAEHQAASLRGDDASKLASAKLSAISSGNALRNKYKGHEDDMTVPELEILAADQVKAVTGVAPTKDEMAALVPHNVGTQWANTKSYFTGSPGPAHSGDWVKQAGANFDEQEKAQRAILENRQKQITSSPRLTPEERERISKMAVPPEFTSAGDPPMQSDVADYAKAHGISYAQAMSIKQARTRTAGN